MEKRKILLVDDSKLFLEMQRTFLNRDSFELFTARTGKEALDSVIKLQPHLVLLSFSMPDMPGDEICSAIKKDLGYSDTRVAIVIEEHGDDIPTRCVDAGCDGIVTKPFEREKLLETVQKLLGETFRRKPRYRIHLPCAVYLEREGIPGIMLDISEIGCRVAAEEHLTKDTGVRIGFNLPDSEQAVNWSGVIRWTVPHRGGEGHSVFGVEFTGTTEDELVMLQDILAAMPNSSRL